MDDKTGIEKFTGNLATQTAFTAVAVSSGTILAALLPLLNNTLANERFKKRVEKELNEINAILLEQQEHLSSLSDNQFKLINEIVLTTLQTVDEEKLQYLKNSVKNTIAGKNENLDNATQLSRILRDISSKEIVFLIKNREYKYITFDENTKATEDLGLNPNSEDGVIATGLISLGLIIPGPDLWQGQKYIYSLLVKELVTIVLT